MADDRINTARDATRELEVKNIEGSGLMTW
jgi:hypothetical protein